jgi:hypothetical protein
VIPLYLRDAVIHALKLPDAYVVEVPSAMASGVSTRLSAHPLVDFVEPVRVRHIVGTAPNDPYYLNSLS